MDADATAEKFRAYLLHFGIEREVQSPMVADAGMQVRNPSHPTNEANGLENVTLLHQSAASPVIHVGCQPIAGGLVDAAPPHHNQQAGL